MWCDARQRCGVSLSVLQLLVITMPLLRAGGSVEGISHGCSAWWPGQRHYWSLDDRSGLVGNRARSLDTGNGFTSSPRYHVAPAALERTHRDLQRLNFDLESLILFCDSLVYGKPVWGALLLLCCFHVSRLYMRKWSSGQWSHVVITRLGCRIPQ